MGGAHNTQRCNDAMRNSAMRFDVGTRSNLQTKKSVDSCFSMKRTITICGPIAGYKGEMTEAVDAFRQAEKPLRDRFPKCTIKSPYRVLRSKGWLQRLKWVERYARKDVMRANIQNLMNSNTIYFLPYWRVSYGSLLEYCIGVELGLELLDTDFSVINHTITYYPIKVK